MDGRAKRVLGAVAVGIAVGVAASVVIPTASSTTSEAPFLLPQESLKIESAAPTSPSAAGAAAAFTLDAASVRTEVRRQDPAGGPGWAIRVFELRPVPGAGGGASAGGTPLASTPATTPTSGNEFCAQLGRIVDGRFGWIDGANVFRPALPTDTQGPTVVCGEPGYLAAHETERTSLTLLDHPEAVDPVIRGSAVWGFTGGGVPHLGLRVGDRSFTPNRSKRDGIFLEFIGPSRSIAEVQSTAQYADGQTRTVGGAASASWGIPGYRPSPGDSIDLASSQLIARVADPAGGPSWGVLGFRTKHGLWCLGAASRLVAGRVGTIDPTLGVLSELPAGQAPNGCGPLAQPTETRPLQIVTGPAPQQPGVPDVQPELGALRLSAGNTVIYGRALPSVAWVTVTTDSEVRTFVPTKPHGGFIVVFAGTPGLGQARFTAHLRDGTVRHMAE